jgi:CIC family chloride channel protein
VVASVTAVVVERSILGNETLFRVPAYQLVYPAELLAYACLGVVGGLISLLFCKGLLRLRACFLRLPARTMVIQPAIGGLLVGITLVFVPEVMGVGYEYVDQALGGGMAMRAMLILCAAKLVATVISYASGNAGGIFAPSLFLGAMAGGVVGTLLERFAPFPTGGPGAYALVGMGTLFAGIIRAPMTSVFMIFELTQDYQILVPLMVANALSFAISRKYQPKPVYHALLEQNHIYLPGPESRFAGAWRVRDIMTSDMDFLPAEIPIQDALETGAARKSAFVLVGSREHLLGFVTSKSAEEAVTSGKGTQPIGSLVSREFEYLHPDQSLEYALERFGPTPGVMPVISRNENRRVEGVITLESILSFVQRKTA